MTASSADNAVQNYKQEIGNTFLIQSRCEYAHKNDPLVIPKSVAGNVNL